MHKMIVMIRLMVALGLNVCAALAYTASIVTEASITNPTVGHQGIDLKIPAGYRSFTPKDKVGENEPFFPGQLAWILSSSLDQRAGLTTLEQLTFENGNRGITLSVVRFALKLPPKQQTKYQEEAAWKITSMWQFAKQYGKYSVENKEKKVALAGGHYVSILRSDVPELAVSTPFVVVQVPPRTLLIFGGISPLKEAQALEADIMQFAESLKLEVTKSPK